MLAGRVGLSPTHLQRIFAHTLGESAKRVASRVALQRAAAALVLDRRTVLEIALDSGFRSHEGFSRAFRRHFGRSPIAYRRRGLNGAQGKAALAAIHGKLVSQHAPCIGLYGVCRDHRARSGVTMSYTIEKKALNETPILFMRKRVTQDQIAAGLGELLPAVFGFAMQRGIALAGPPLCRYRDFTPGGVTLEAGMAVAAAIEGDGEVRAGSLAGGPVASTIHVGPYDRLHEAHTAIEEWLSSNGLQAGGDPWEVYLTDPGEVPDPSQWQTEVIQPIG